MKTNKHRNAINNPNPNPTTVKISLDEPSKIRIFISYSTFTTYEKIHQFFIVKYKKLMNVFIYYNEIKTHDNSYCKLNSKYSNIHICFENIYNIQKYN